MGLFGSSVDEGSPQERVDIADLKARVARLEAAVVQLQSAAVVVPASPGGPAPPADWLGEVRALKARGKLIPAIKLYRDHTGAGLREAKDAVEGLV